MRFNIFYINKILNKLSLYINHHYDGHGHDDRGHDDHGHDRDHDGHVHGCVHVNEHL
jgi:hypothetical protein